MINSGAIAAAAAAAAGAGRTGSPTLGGLAAVGAVLATVWSAIAALNSTYVHDFRAVRAGEKGAMQFLSERRQLQNQRSGENSLLPIEPYKPFLTSAFKLEAGTQLIVHPRVFSSHNPYDLGFIKSLIKSGAQIQGSEQQAFPAYSRFALINYDSQGKQLKTPYLVPIAEKDVLDVHKAISACRSAQEKPCLAPTFNVLAVNVAQVPDQSGYTYKISSVAGYYQRPEIG